MIASNPDWIPDPTKNRRKIPDVTSSGLDGSGTTAMPALSQSAPDSGHARVARAARTGTRRMSLHSIALAIVIAVPFAAFLAISIYKSGMWLPTLAIALIFAIRHRRRSARVDRKARAPAVGRNDAQ